jgi:hypothetical protein
MGKDLLRGWLGFVPLFIGSLHGVVGFVGVDSVMQIFGWKDWVTSVQGFFQHPPLWFFPLLIALFFVGFGIAYWREKRSMRESFEEDWGGMDYERNILKKTINRAFEKWWRETTPMRPQEFARKAGFPEDVLLISSRSGETIYDYAGRAMGQWSGEKRALLGFCVALYRERGDSDIITDSEYEEMDGARSRLSKFWDKWGRKCFDRQEMSVRDFPLQLMKGEIFHLILLTYLEIAHARPAEDMGKGKQGLFRMAKVFSDIGN